MAIAPTSAQSNENELITIDVASIPQMTDFIMSSERTHAYPSPKNIEELEFNYNITLENIKLSLDTARLIRENINNFTNEHILKSTSIQIDEVRWNSVHNSDIGGVLVPLNKTLCPLGDSYKTVMFEPGSAGIKSQIKLALKRYKNTNSGPAKSLQIIDEYSEDKWVKIKDFNTVFTLMAHHNSSTNAVMKNVDKAFEALDNLDSKLVPDKITDFYIQAIIEKVQGKNTTKISDTINELDKIINTVNEMHTAEFFMSRMINLVKSIFMTASKILSGNKKTMYSFLLHEFGNNRSDFEKIFLGDSISSSTEKMISKGIKSSYNYILEWDSINGPKMKWSPLKKLARLQNTIVIDRGASNKRWRKPTEYLDTNTVDKKQYGDTIESVAKNFDNYKTEEERYLIAIAMKMILTSRGQYFLGASKEETTSRAIASDGRQSDDIENGICNINVTFIAADEGGGDKKTDVIKINLEPNDLITNAFTDAFIKGKDDTSSPHDFVYAFQDSNPIKDVLNDVLKNYIPVYLHIKELTIIAERAALLKQLLQDIDNIDASVINTTFEGDYSGLLQNGETNIALAVKEYCDALQTSSASNIQNRYTPPSQAETVALEVLFSENELLKEEIGEQKKIFSLGITRAAIGTIHAPRELFVNITKKDKFNPDIKFKTYTHKIDILRFPVINGYKFFSTQLDDTSEISTGDKPVSADSYSNFYDFVKKGMHFIDLGNISEKASEKSVIPQTMDDITERLTPDGRIRIEKKLIESAKSHVIGIYLRSLLGTEFKGIDLDESDVHRTESNNDDAWYDDNAEESYNRTYATTSSELGKRFKDTMLYTSTIFNNKKITNDILYLHDIMYTYHIMLDIDDDFEQIFEEGTEAYSNTKVLENLEFEVTSFFASTKTSTIKDDAMDGSI